jgi:hypothetical protein
MWRQNKKSQGEKGKFLRLKRMYLIVIIDINQKNERKKHKDTHTLAPCLGHAAAVCASQERTRTKGRPEEREGTEKEDGKKRRTSARTHQKEEKKKEKKKAKGRGKMMRERAKTTKTPNSSLQLPTKLSPNRHFAKQAKQNREPPERGFCF